MQYELLTLIHLMVTTQPPSPNTTLTDRVVWHDGCSTFNADNIANYITKYDVRYVDRLTPSIIQYNKNVGADDKLSVKTSIDPLHFDWQIPNSYKNLNLVDFIFEAHAILTEGMDPREVAEREVRLATELNMYIKMGLADVLRTVTWVISKLAQSGTVWGIGRGSSTSSYVLYVIGVHDVDSFAYQLDIGDFLRT